MRTVYGTLGDDRLFGFNDEDVRFFGFSGDDTLFGGNGNDTLNGGQGTDRVQYTTWFQGNPYFINGVSVDLAAGRTTAVLQESSLAHVLIGIENVAGSNFNDTLSGDGQNNTLQGRDGDDTLNGGAGDDQLFGGRGNDFIYGGAGNDELFAMQGNDTLDGGEGRDEVSFEALSSGSPVFVEGVSVELAARLANAQIDGQQFTYFLENVENLEGSEFDDMLRGDENDNEIRGRRGNDTLFGQGGDDWLFGGLGDDLLYGDAGDDALYATKGDDTLNGGDGRDEASFRTSTGSGPIFVEGVTVDLGSRQAVAQIEGQTYRYTLESIETLEGSRFADALTGDEGDNELQGREGDDTLIGGDGNDTLFGGLGNDSVLGGDGNDSLYATEGNETLDGGEGRDWVMFNTARGDNRTFVNGVEADLSIASASAQVGEDTFTYTLVEIEGFQGTRANDSITGSGANNLLSGLDGDDILNGLAGNDTLSPSIGNDTIDGGAGEDLLSFDFGAFDSGLEIDIANKEARGTAAGQGFVQSFSNIERIIGTVFDDVIISSSGNDQFLGNLGNDIAVYDGASDRFSIQLDFTEDTVRIVDRSGAEGTDTGGINILRFTNRDWTLTADGDREVARTDLDPSEYISLVELYIAYFNRAPDAEGLYFWTCAFINGSSLDEVAEFFFDQPETRLIYGDTPDAAEFVTSVYQNVLGRGPDEEGRAFWIDSLMSGDVSEGQFIRIFLNGVRAEAPEGASSSFVAQQNVDQTYLENKTDVGVHFGAVLGMSNIEHANNVMKLFDGSTESLTTAFSASDEYYQAALATDGSGEFLIQLVGLIDDVAA